MFSVDGGALRRLLKERFGRVAIPPEAWESPQLGLINRSTLHRWCNGTVTPRPDYLFEVAGLLDVDPLVILMPAPDSFRDGFLLFHEAPSLANFGDDAALLATLVGTLRSRPTWPRDDFSRQFFGRNWVRRFVEHDRKTRADYYERFTIRFAEGVGDKVVHFAWKGPRGRSWSPYGFVAVTPASLNLYSYDGSASNCPIDGAVESIAVETWFGSGSASFCLASLHPFEVLVGDDGESSDPTVRFAVD